MVRILTDVTAGLSRSIDEGGLLAKTLDVVSIAVKGVDIALAVGIATVETFYQVFKTEMAAVGDITVSVGRPQPGDVRASGLECPGRRLGAPDRAGELVDRDLGALPEQQGREDGLLLRRPGE